MTALSPDPHRARSSRRRRRLIVLAVLATLAAAYLGYFSTYLFRNNFGVVDPGRLYRSAQPKDDLADRIRDHDLASVLNLRGGWTTDWWYANELEQTTANDVVWYDLPMPFDEQPSRRELLLLLDIFDRGPYPMLVHCKSGSDRTGLAASLYRLYVLGQPPEEAEQGFSFYHAHIPLLGPATLHEPIDAYTAWLGDKELAHTPQRFRDWVETEYREVPHERRPSDVAPIPLPPGPRVEWLREAEREPVESAVVEEESTAREPVAAP